MKIINVVKFEPLYRLGSSNNGLWGEGAVMQSGFYYFLIRHYYGKYLHRPKQKVFLSFSKLYSLFILQSGLEITAMK